MGCCFSKADSKSQAGEPNERTTLLGNPVSNTAIRPLYNEDYRTDFVASQNHLIDELDALNKILHKTACDIIDVSALPTRLEQKEYVDRFKFYQQKLNMVQWCSRGEDYKNLLQDLPFPENILSVHSICLSDRKMVLDSFEQVSHAMQEIKIEHKEDLVAYFVAV